MSACTFSRAYGGRYCLLLLLCLSGCGGTGEAVGPDTGSMQDGRDGAVLADGVDVRGPLDTGDQLASETKDSLLEDRAVEDLALECPASNAPPGCPCDDNTDCASGFCVMHLGEKVCTSECIEECPVGYSCEEASPGGMDKTFICVSDYPSLCLPCTTDEDCESTERCVWYGTHEGAFCGKLCDTAVGCPAGYVCQDSETVAGALVSACVLGEGMCPCSDYAAAQHLWTVCENVNEFGACSGTRECGEEGLTPCPAPAPGKEFCNDLDDDCDGVIDEPPACADCMCGDGVCVETGCHEGWKEGLMTCAPDCSVCGNGLCDPGEGPVKCPEDCCGACGDGKCKGGECGEDDPEGPKSCPGDCGAIACGDGACDPGENPVDCPTDCEKYACGNGTCEPGEDPNDCPEDCAETCGDCECAGGESYDTCPTDCGFCGDGYCINICQHLSETVALCLLDCCIPDCEGKDCGPDGCGGVCGDCPAFPNFTCEEGICQCVPDTCSDLSVECGEWPDGCGETTVCEDCPIQHICSSEGICLCIADCLGKQCGPDGCGGSCGLCPCVGCDATYSVCNETSGMCELDCVGISYCLSGCNPNDQTCQQNCMNAGTVDAQNQYTAIIQCLIDNGGQECTDAECQNDILLEYCMTEHTACFSGDMTCSEAFDCMDACAYYAYSCGQLCLYDATPDAQAQLLAIQDCLFEQCGEQFTEECVQASQQGACAAVFADCFNLAKPGFATGTNGARGPQ